MKLTDYLPRVAPSDKYLTGKKNLVGVEVGVDAGAHAEALLLNQDIERLYLVDIWDSMFAYGYASGRLETKGYKDKTEFLQMTSEEGWKHFSSDVLDFVYLDSLHDEEVVRQDLNNWWVKVKPGGILVQRNYSGESGLVTAVDEFLQQTKARSSRESVEIVLWKE